MNAEVTCFCATRNRRDWLPFAIECFQGQTYQNKRMLIVADGDDVEDLIPSDERISLISLEESERPKTNGQKFNLCCWLAEDAEFLCKWDDDDWSAPGRLTDQMERLEDSGKAVTGYHTMMFTDGTGWWKYPGYDMRETFSMGTSLCFTREWWSQNKFEPAQVGSDNSFVRRAGNGSQLASADARELMVATIHAKNTSPRQLKVGPWIEMPDYRGPAGYRFPV